MQRFTNNWYPLLLTYLLGSGIFTGIQDLVYELNWLPFIRLTLCLTITIAILTKATFTKIILKFWSVILMLGGVLGLINIFIYLIIGSFEKIEPSKIIIHLFYVIVGYMIFRYWNSSVEIRETHSDEE